MCLLNKLVKVIAWRGVSVLITVGVMWAFTGSVRDATGLTVSLHVLLTIANYYFEMMWEKYYESR